MAEELIQVTNTPVTVDAQTAEDRGDNFVPTDDDVVFVDEPASGAAPAPAPAPAAAAPAPADAPAADPAAAPAAAAAPADAPAPAPAAAAPAASASAAEDHDTDENGQRGSSMIPKARFNEVNEARKQAQSRADELARENERLRAEATRSSVPAPAAAPAAPTFDVEAKEREYLEAVLDGKNDAAVGIRKEINAHIQEEARQSAMQSFHQQSAQTALQDAANQAVKDFPYLDTKDGEMAMNVIIAERDRRMSAGEAPAVALRSAVALIAPRFAPAQAAPAPAPAPATPSSGLTPAPAPVDTRTADAIKRGAEDSQAQPPSLAAGIGNRATQARIDVKNLTEEQFADLPDAEKKRLRGD